MNYIYKFLFIAVAGLFVSCRFGTDDKNGLINAYLLSNGKIVCNSKAIKAYIISYENQQGRVPEQIALVEDTCMTLEHLPVLEDSGVYEFAGWYFNDKKISVGYRVSSKMNLTAFYELKGDGHRFIEISDVENAGKTGLVPFRINAFETTFALWHSVYSWAVKRGYKFQNTGAAGSSGTTDKLDAFRYFPATSMTPQDAIVWCNAYSEKVGLKPVYYEDEDFTKIIKDSSIITTGYPLKNPDGSIYYDNNGKEVIVSDGNLHNIYVDLTKNGYRLPTYDEWLYAAQGALRTDQDKNYKYSGSNTLEEVASLGSYHAVGMYKPNGAGTYDQTGNAAEFCLTDLTIGLYGAHYSNGTGNAADVDKYYSLYGSSKNLCGIMNAYPQLCSFRYAQTIVK